MKFIFGVGRFYFMKKKQSELNNEETVELTLTTSQIDMLSKLLWSHTDCGPDDEGWASEELDELRKEIDRHKK